jgi:hypothetical protein
MHNDHQPYYVRVGDRWTKIDYAKKPREWMVPLQRGQETDLIGALELTVVDLALPAPCARRTGQGLN